tara:strand:+ start:28207 stop:28416 length:210 start_codon:yes stop_codon:yes gene_type:complete
MLKAALAHFIAARQRAAANLENYLSNPVAIGEHPDLVGEVITLIEELDSASSKINTVHELLSGMITEGE